jgi:hypothetical protein
LEVRELSYDIKLARARELIQKRDEIDAELDGMFSGVPVAKRGRPKKEQNGEGEPAQSETA